MDSISGGLVEAMVSCTYPLFVRSNVDTSMHAVHAPVASCHSIKTYVWTTTVCVHRNITETNGLTTISAFVLAGYQYQSSCVPAADCYPGLVCTYNGLENYAHCATPVAVGGACGAKYGANTGTLFATCLERVAFAVTCHA